MSRPKVTSTTSCYLQAVVSGKSLTVPGHTEQKAFESPTVQRLLTDEDLKTLKKRLQDYVEKNIKGRATVELLTVCTTVSTTSRGATRDFLWEREYAMNCTNWCVFRGEFPEFLNYKLS